MPNVGPLEIAIVLVIVLIIFGPKRLPELGKSLGKGIRDFRGAMGSDDDDDDDVSKKRAALESNPVAAEPPAAPAAPEAEKPVEGEVITERKG
jgi:sec-independent protein translocase protein TatA